MDHLKGLELVLGLGLLVAACGGEADTSESTESQTYDASTSTCYVPYEDITCHFVCSDCADPETGEYREGSCENALPTALDHCTFQKRWPNGYDPDGE